VAWLLEVQGKLDDAIVSYGQKKGSPQCLPRSANHEPQFGLGGGGGGKPLDPRKNKPEKGQTDEASSFCSTGSTFRPSDAISWLLMAMHLVAKERFAKPRASLPEDCLRRDSRCSRGRPLPPHLGGLARPLRFQGKVSRKPERLFLRAPFMKWLRDDAGSDYHSRMAKFVPPRWALFFFNRLRK